MEAPIPGVSIGLMGYGMVMVEVIVREMLGMSCCCCCCFCVECRKMSPVGEVGSVDDGGYDGDAQADARYEVLLCLSRQCRSRLQK